MSNYTVYIDEAGDLGINRGTKWFVLTAVIVAKEAEPKIRAKIRQIKSKLIKYFTSDMKPDVEDLKSRRICLKA